MRFATHIMTRVSALKPVKFPLAVSGETGKVNLKFSFFKQEAMNYVTFHDIYKSRMHTTHMELENEEALEVFRDGLICVALNKGMDLEMQQRIMDLIEDMKERV